MNHTLGIFPITKSISYHVFRQGNKIHIVKTKHKEPIKTWEFNTIDETINQLYRMIL